MNDSYFEIDCSQVGKALLAAKVRDFALGDLSFRIVNVPSGKDESLVPFVRRVLERNGFDVFERCVTPGWLQALLTVVVFPVGIALLVKTLRDAARSRRADFVIYRLRWSNDLTVRCQRKDEEFSKTEYPACEASEITVDGKVELHKAISYFVHLRAKYRIAHAAWKPVREQLVHIKHRQADPLFYLGVVGEAAAGKSTLINALLGFSFLKEDVNLGTTAATTVIRCGKRTQIDVRFVDGRVESYDERSLGLSGKVGSEKWSEGILNTVHRFTAEESVAIGVERVEISLPVRNELFGAGVAIVDTPGLNSGNPRHNDVTTRAVRDVCDAALILVPANVPLSACLTKYLQENLSGMLGRCVLVMTQEDKLRSERDRVAQLKYVTARLTSATGTSVAGSVRTAAYYVLDRDDYGRADATTVAAYRKAFREMVKNLESVVTACRERAILEKLYFFIKQALLPILTNLLRDRQEEIKSRSEALAKNQLMELGGFLKNEIADRSAEINATVIGEESIRNVVIGLRDGFLSKMCARVRGTDGRSALKNVMQECVIQSELNGLGKEFAASLQGLCTPYETKLGQTLTAFHKKFSEAYRNLENVSGNTALATASALGEKSVEVSVAVPDFAGVVNSEIGADVVRSGVGAGAGFVVGNFIFPGLGGIIGGILGGLAGLLFGKSLDELQNDACSALHGVADNWMVQMQPQAYQYVDSYRKTCVDQLKSKIRAYKAVYGEKIAALIRDEKAEQDGLRSLNSAALADLDILDALRPQLERMISQSRQDCETNEGGTNA